MRKPSPALAISIVALFVSLGGTSLAAKHYLITETSQIKPSVLRSLKGERGPRGLTGPRGLQGLTGAAGIVGPQGGPGLSGVNVVTGPSSAIPDGTTTTVTANCPAGQRAIGGGFFVSIAHPGAALPGFSSYSVILSNDTGITINANAYAVCANVA
jgi:hypothetical protein